MAPRRARADWERLVEHWRKSGSTQVEFARHVGVKVSTLRWWIHELRRTSPLPVEEPVRLMPVRVEPAVARWEPGRVEAEVAGVRLCFDTGTEPDYLAALVSALEGRRC